MSRAVGIRQQGAWTRWESMLQRKVTWSNIMQADLHRVRFLVQATRPDMIIISEASKHLIMLELTVPWEERIEEANQRKGEKYQELVGSAEALVGGQSVSL